MTDTPQDAPREGPEAKDGYVRGLNNGDRHGEFLDGLSNDELRDLIVDALVTTAVREEIALFEQVTNMYNSLRVIEAERAISAALFGDPDAAQVVFMDAEGLVGEIAAAEAEGRLEAEGLDDQD